MPKRPVPKKRRTKKETYAKLVKTANLGIPSGFTSDVIDIIIQKRIDDKLREGGISAPAMQVFGKEIIHSLEEKQGWNKKVRSFIDRALKLIYSILGVISLWFTISKVLNKFKKPPTNRASQSNKPPSADRGSSPKPPPSNKKKTVKVDTQPNRTESLDKHEIILNNLNEKQKQKKLEYETALHFLQYAKNKKKYERVVAEHNAEERSKEEAKLRKKRHANLAKKYPQVNNIPSELTHLNIATPARRSKLRRHSLPAILTRNLTTALSGLLEGVGMNGSVSPIRIPEISTREQTSASPSPTQRPLRRTFNNRPLSSWSSITTSPRTPASNRPLGTSVSPGSRISSPFANHSVQMPPLNTKTRTAFENFKVRERLLAEGKSPENADHIISIVRSVHPNLQRSSSSSRNILSDITLPVISNNIGKSLERSSTPILTGFKRGIWNTLHGGR